MGEKDRVRAVLCAAIAAAVLAGCASSQFDYVPPTTQAPQTQFKKTVDKPRDVLWDAAVPALGKEFFVINNIDRASGLINVSYSGDPHAYIDCGHMSGFFSNAHGRRDFSFDGSEKDASYDQYKHPNAFHVQRHMNLEGRMNIIFESPTAGTTTVTVNARYIVEKRAYVQLFTGQSGSNVDQIAFSTNSSGSFAPTNDGNTTTCVATGKLEESILGLIR